MKIMQRMRVFHFLKADPSETLPPLDPGLWTLDTCQRMVIAEVRSGPSALSMPSSQWQTYEDQEAYTFLLELGCGLHSALVGETEIAGQIRKAWKSFETTESRDLVGIYRPWFESLFRDIKMIRSQFLQGVGGSSYGTLVRKILRPTSTDPILILGAGQMAEAVLPYLGQSPVLLWNRNRQRADLLAEKLFHYKRVNIRVIPELDDEALRDICHVLFCIPANEVIEENIFQIFSQLERPGHSRILHLGHTENQRWKNFPGYFSLGSVFSLRDKQNSVRSLQISRAQQAAQDQAPQTLRWIQERANGVALQQVCLK